jgi:hypothetical protein
MASRIVSLDRTQAAPAPAHTGAPGRRVLARPHVWRGASGRRYAHHVYGLVECPPLPAANYILVRRDAGGRRTALRIGIGRSKAPTLNLAEVRRYGAQAGANEVHVCLDAASDAERRLIACDLRAGLLGTLAAEAGPDATTLAEA